MVHFSLSVVSDSLWLHGVQHARLLSPSPTPKSSSNSCPLSQWCHPTISSSVVPFSLQYFPASESFSVGQFVPSGGQSIGVSPSTSVLPMNIWDWFPLGLIALISLQSKRFSSVFCTSTVHKHQFFGSGGCVWAFSSCDKWELLFIVLCWFLILVASLAMEHRP